MDTQTIITALDIFIKVIAGILAALLIFIAFHLFSRRQDPPPQDRMRKKDDEYWKERDGRLLGGEARRQAAIKNQNGVIGKRLGGKSQAHYSDRR